MFDRSRRRVTARRSVIAIAVAVTVAIGGAASAAVYGGNPFGTSHVGTQTDGRILLNDNQWLAPYGQRTMLSGWSAGSAISPDGTKVAEVTGGYASTISESPSLEILDAATGKVLQSFGGPGIAAPVYSPDGTALYAPMSTVFAARQGTTSILKYTVGPDGLVTNPGSPQTIALGSLDFPFGMAVSQDGSKLYSVLNGTNQLGVVDTATNQLVDRIRVGQVPQAVAIAGNQAFVSNRGGRVPGAGDTTNLSGVGTAVGGPGLQTPIVSNQVTGASTTGTVSVVNLATNTVTGTINVGLQPTSLTVHDGSVFVTNTNSDTVSIIDAASHKVTQTFNVEPLPGSTVGASPNSVTFADPHHLLVSVGRDNAIAEFLYNGPRAPVQYQGLVPTDWYPNQVQYDGKVGKVIVSNERGIGSNGANKVFAIKGTVTSFSPPANLTLGTLTHQVFTNNGWDHLPASNGNGQGNENGQGGPPPAIPAQLGQPSAIKHVFLIIKENEPYDAFFGDLGKGNGDPALTLYGAQVTPNEHSLVNTFSLFDNFYENGQVTGDGHTWLAQADNNDYVEQNLAAGDARGAPQSAGDALSYQRDGFLWTTAEHAGKSVKTYGEYDALSKGTLGTWQQYYADSQILEGKATGTLPVPLDQFQSTSEFPSVNAVNNPDYPLLTQTVPDQFRTDVWEQDFRQAEKTGNLPNLTIMTLGDDHTGGGPTARAQVADNDLALGRIVSDISHSQFWKNSAVFSVEDDTQNAHDHVDGHRGPLWIASPYAKRGVVNSDYATQINVVKTIEQILGAQPMNQMDRAAVPMFSAFTNTPNMAPYQTLPNQIPLTEGVTGLIPQAPTAATAADPKAAAALAATVGPPAPPVPAAERSVAAAWTSWYKTQAEPKLSGRHAQVDSVNPPELDRYDWYTTTGWTRPYPGDNAILAPDQVLGRNLPVAGLGDG